MSNEELLSQPMNSHFASVELELWHALLSSEGVTYNWQPDQIVSEEDFQVEDLPEASIAYPWNPADSEAESFFDASHRVSIFEGWQESEISTRAQDLFSHMDHLWSVTSLHQTLQKRLSIQVPHHLLATIAQKASQVAATSVSLADQLVQCVRDSLPNLAEDDLYVLARPYAYALRDGGSQAVELSKSNLPQQDWHRLSEIHQARLSLAIARCALDEVQTQRPQ